MNMFTLTQALQNAFIGPRLTDPSNGKAGPAFADLDRMEDFWEVNTSQSLHFFCYWFSFHSI